MKKSAFATIGLAVLLSVAGCKKEGPAEKAGEKIDKLGNKVEDTVNPPKGPAEAAGRAVDRTVNQ